MSFHIRKTEGGLTFSAFEEMFSIENFGLEGAAVHVATEGEANFYNFSPAQLRVLSECVLTLADSLEASDEDAA